MSKMDPDILWSMLVLTFGFWMYSFATTFARVRGIILSREADAEWVKEVVTTEKRS
jgi:heme exporter protein C